MSLVFVNLINLKWAMEDLKASKNPLRKYVLYKRYTQMAIKYITPVKTMKVTAEFLAEFIKFFMTFFNKDETASACFSDDDTKYALFISIPTKKYSEFVLSVKPYRKTIYLNCTSDIEKIIIEKDYKDIIDDREYNSIISDFMYTYIHKYITGEE